MRSVRNPARFPPPETPTLARKPPKRQRVTTGQRARSVPYKRPFVGAIIITVVFYLALVGVFAALFVFFSGPDPFTAAVLIGFGAASVVLWLVSFLKRRDARCPLCKGTPFLDSAARRHVHARRAFPFNYGTSAILGSIFKQKYTCQYCGTPFDLLKIPDKQARAKR